MGKGSAAKGVTSLGLVCAGLVKEVEEMAVKGDGVAGVGLTVFDAQKGALPTVGLGEYVERWVTYSGCSKMSLVLASVYLVQSGIQVTSLNKHRLLLACLVVAAKFHDDVFYSNSFYAAVGGASLGEVNRLEQSILHACDWAMCVSKPEYEARLITLLKTPPMTTIPALAPKHPQNLEKITAVTIMPPSCVDRFFSFFGLN